MANKKNQEFVELSTDDLKFELGSAQAKYQNMLFDHQVTPLEQPRELKEVRRDIARIKTEIRKREISAMTPEQIANRSRTRARRSRS